MDYELAKYLIYKIKWCHNVHVLNKVSMAVRETHYTIREFST